MFMQTSDIWSLSRRILLIIPFTGVEDLMAYRNAIKESGINVNDSQILCVLSDKNEKAALREIFGVSFMHSGDFNWLGKIKDAKTEKVLFRSYDLLIVVGPLKGRFLKLLKKMKHKFGVGLNQAPEHLPIKLESSKVDPAHLINFVQETLKKIDSNG